MTVRRIVATVLSLLPVAVGSQPAANSSSARSAIDVFHKKLFISYQQASLSGVPISYAQGNPNGINDDRTAKSSGTGSALGIGGSWILRDHWLVQLAYDRASASFSDWRVRNRSLAFSSVDFTVGYATNGPVSLVPYLTVAPGWYSQSEFKEYDFNSASPGPDESDYESMDKFDYDFGFAIGMKLGLARYFALNGEMRWYKEDTGGGGGSCGPNCTVIDVSDRPPAKSYGSRASFGVQIYWWK
jgi:hypothetical protein